MELSGTSLDNLSASIHTIAELEELAQMVGRSTALARIRADQGSAEKAEIWSAEAKVHAERAEPITALYPEMQSHYANIVARVVDSYFELT